MSSKYPRTEWVHAVRAYFDAQPEQLALFDVPEPPRSMSRRMFFLVVADYARPDGSVMLSAEGAAKRWAMAVQTVEQYIAEVRRAGWLRNVGTTAPGRLMPRQLVIPERWANTTNAPPVDTPRGAGNTPPVDGGRPRVTGGVSQGQRGVSRGDNAPPGDTPLEVVRSQSSQEGGGAAPAAHPTTHNTDPTGPPPNDVIDRFREDLNTHLPARLRLTRTANPRIASCVATGHTPERVARWVEQSCTLPKLHTAGPILDVLESYAAGLAESSAGPESRTAAEVIGSTRVTCDHGTPTGQRCGLCANPGGAPRDPAIPDRTPVFIKETRAERVARKHAEAEARDEAERAERAARRKAREAALATDPVIGPEKPAGTRPPTEAEVIALAADQAAEQARWANQPDDDTDPDEEEETA